MEKVKKGLNCYQGLAGIIGVKSHLLTYSSSAIIKAVGQEFRGRPDIVRKAAIHISHRYSGRTLMKIRARVVTV
jgi:hypothetical protein